MSASLLLRNALVVVLALAGFSLALAAALKLGLPRYQVILADPRNQNVVLIDEWNNDLLSCEAEELGLDGPVIVCYDDVGNARWLQRFPPRLF